MKPVKIIEIVLISMAVLGFTLQIFGIEAAEFVVTISLFALTLFYVFQTILLFEKQKRKTALSIYTGILIGFTLISIMCKIQLVPVRSNFLIEKSFFPLGLIISYSLYKFYKRDEYQPFYKKILIRSSILVALALLVYIIPSKVFAYLYFRHDSTLLELEIQRIENPNEEKYYIAIDEYKKERKMKK